MKTKLLKVLIRKGVIPQEDSSPVVEQDAEAQAKAKAKEDSEAEAKKQYYANRATRTLK